MRQSDSSTCEHGKPPSTSFVKDPIHFLCVKQMFSLCGKPMRSENLRAVCGLHHKANFRGKTITEQSNDHRMTMSIESSDSHASPQRADEAMDNER